MGAATMSNWWDNYCDDTVYYSSPTFDGYVTSPKYTAELREFFDQYYVDPMTTAQLIEAGRANLFDFTYPLYNAGVKTQFETGIIRQFFFREIGFDTFGIFKFRLENWLNLNMPYFNKLYLSIAIEDEKSPLDNSNRNETYTKTIDRDNTVAINDLEKVTDANGTSSSDADNTTNRFNRDILSNTPDTRLQLATGEDGSGMTGIIEYASQIDENKSIDKIISSVDDTTTAKTTETTNGTTVQTDNKTETYTQEAHGKIGIQSYAHLLKEYRENLARVDKMLYREINELFMLLY